AHDDEGQGQAEVVLHEADTALEALARDRQVGDGTRLGRHHAEPDRPPAGGGVAAQVGVEAPHVTRAPGAVPRDAHERPHQHDPVDGAHQKLTVNTTTT